MRETPFNHVRRIDTAQTAHQGALYIFPHVKTCLKCHKNDYNWAEVGNFLEEPVNGLCVLNK